MNSTKNLSNIARYCRKSYSLSTASHKPLIADHFENFSFQCNVTISLIPLEREPVYVAAPGHDIDDTYKLIYTPVQILCLKKSSNFFFFFFLQLPGNTRSLKCYPLKCQFYIKGSCCERREYRKKGV